MHDLGETSATASGMTRSSSIGWLLALVLVVAASVRISVAIWWQAQLPQGTAFYFGDSYSYWSLAGRLAHGEPYAYGDQRVFRSPGLPLLLAPAFWLGGGEPPPLWGRWIVAMAGTASVAATYLLGRVMFSAQIGLCAAAAMAIYPTNVFLGGMVLSEAPFAAAMLLQLACWIAAWQQREKPRLAGLLAAGAGLAAGTATLIRPSWLLFTPLAIGAALVLCRDRRHHLPQGTVLLAVLVATLLPWWIRNYRVTGQFVPTTLQVGASLYDGLHPAATGASNMDFVRPLTEEFRREWEQLPAERPKFEVYADQRFRQQALDWAAHRPRRTGELAVVKFLRIWNFWPNAEEFSAGWMRLLLLATYTPLMLLAVLGIIRFRNRGWPILLCCLPALYVALLHTVFVGSIRYREPAMMPLAVLAAAWLVTQVGGKDSRHLSAHD